MPGSESDGDFWRKRAITLSRRINFAWFLQVSAGPLLIASALAAVLVLLLRREAGFIDPLTLSWSVAGLLVVVLMISFFIARRNFESPDTTLIRIEASEALDSSLSAAKAGLIPWPAAPPHSGRAPLKWHMPRAILPSLVSVAVLAAGLLIPIDARTSRQDQPVNQPQAWSRMDSQLEQLAEDAMVDEEYIEEMQERLDELRAQKEEDWFGHASLEATDSLQDAQNSDIAKLGQDLNEAENALESLLKNAENLPADQKNKLAQDFEKALEGMKNGAMKPNPELLDQLSKLDPSDLGKLTPEQLSQLKENMGKLQQSLGEAGETEGENWEDQLLADQQQNGEGQSEGEGEPRPGNGSGGIQRGPGHDPGVLKDQKDPLEIGELTPLKAKDLSQAIPGDLLELQNGKHSVDESASKASDGGIASQGKGGDRVWKDSLAPDEQRALKKYFE